MIYPFANSKVAQDGELSNRFFNYYDELKSSGGNIGWKLINEKFPASLMVRYSTKIDPVIFNIKFLEP